jgi:hypothetical protein
MPEGEQNFAVLGALLPSYTARPPAGGQAGRSAPLGQASAGLGDVERDRFDEAVAADADGADEFPGSDLCPAARAQTVDETVEILLVAR